MCCKLFSEDSAYGNCVDCISIDLEGLGGVESVPFYSWIQGEKYYSKQLKKHPGIEVKRKLTGMFAKLLLHYFTKRTQSREYNAQTLEPGQVIIHVDYSENYRQQNEIKSDFYGQGQFTSILLI